jgi:gliding motility-associated-like protein
MFTWDFGDGSPPLVFDHTNWGQTISHTYQQGTVSCETVVLLTAENYCNTLQGGPSAATFNPIRVWDIDTAVISASATLLCYPDTVVDFLNTSIRNCIDQGNIHQRYEYWNFGDYWGTGTDSIFDWSPWPPAAPYTIAYPGIGTYQAMLLDSNICGIDTAYITIQIVPPPSVTLTVNPDTVCVGEAAFFNQTTVGGANSFQWNFGDGNGWQALAGDQSQAFYQPGTYYVQYAASIVGATAGCADTAGVQVTVMPAPTAAFTLSDSAACDTLPVTFTNNSSGGTTYAWNLGNGNTSPTFTPPLQTYNDPGPYLISLTVTDGFGCYDIATSTVNIFEPPFVNINPTGGCLGDSTSIGPQLVLAPNDSVVSYQWSMGDGTSYSDSIANHLYGTSGTFQVQLDVITIECSGSAITTVTVNPPPTASFTADSVAGCSPLTVNLTNTSSNATNYQWYTNVNNITTTTNKSYTFFNVGDTDSTIVVTLVAFNGNGCSDTTTMAFTIHPLVSADFTYSTTTGCAPLDVQFTNASTNATTYAWDFGDGTTSNLTNPMHTFINNTLVLQTYTITLVASDSLTGCSGTYSQILNVFPTANFSFTPLPDSGCSPLFVSFPVVLGAVSYIWDFGDGSSAQGAPMQHTFLNGGTTDTTYNVTLITSNAFGCSDTSVQAITVYPQPISAFVATPLVQQMPNSTVQLINIGSNSTDFQYTWFFGNGASSSSMNPVSYTYSDPGTYDLMLVVSNANCADTSVQQVQIIGPDPIPTFLGSGEGCSPLTIDFTNTTPGGVAYQWDFGDGGSSTLENPSHTYTIPGIYTVALTVTGAGGTSNTTVHIDSVEVYPTAVANFTWQPATIVVPDEAVYFFNLSANANSYWWDFGDGATSTVTSPVHYYSDTGRFDVTLIANNAYNCPDTFQVTSAVIARGAGDLQFPNAFTPTSNGPTNGVYDIQSFDNDFFFPIHEGVAEYQLRIYNRWGELVFESSDVNIGWDGYYRGQPAKQDVYVWKAQAVFTNGDKVSQAGDVTLLR